MISKTKENIFVVKNAIIFFAVFFIIATINCSAQRLREGSLDFLKGQEFLHVVLDFDNAKLQGKPQMDYLAMENPQWVQGWETAKNTFMDAMLEQLNNNVRAQALQCGNFPDANYQATIRILTLRRKGFGQYLEGPGIRNVTSEVIFTRIGDTEPLAKITRLNTDSKAKTSVFVPQVARDVVGIVGGAGSNAHLTRVAFSNMGQDLGRFLARRIR